MRAPQIIYIVLISIRLLYTAYKHGQPRDDDYNILIALIGTALGVGLLIWGGFFG